MNKEICRLLSMFDDMGIFPTSILKTPDDGYQFYWNKNVFSSIRFSPILEVNERGAFLLMLPSVIEVVKNNEKPRLQLLKDQLVLEGWQINGC